MSNIALPARYYRNYVDTELTNSEQNLEHAEQTLYVRTDETALVLVDCWDLEHLEGPRFQRGTPIMEERIAPVLEAARESDVTVVHAPGRQVVTNYPQWTDYADDEDIARTTGSLDREGPDWPPEEFRNRNGEYDHLEKKADQAAKTERYGDAEIRPKDSIHESVEPEVRPDEFVVSTGDQLHRLLSHRELLHLVYVGFNSNFCIPFRDYGMRAMDRRGYNAILLRDCTKAIEAHDTYEEALCDRMAIRHIERAWGWSAESADFVDALEAAGT